jgi:hypothetical protein
MKTVVSVARRWAASSACLSEHWMGKVLKKPQRDHRQLQQIIAGLAEGVILVVLDQSILWANVAALRMHGVKRS